MSDDLDTTIAQLDGWTRDGESIHRTYAFDDYSQAVAFTMRAALLAEKRNHHPDLLLAWGKVEATLTTHDDGGLTTKDTDLAAELNDLVRD